MLKGHTFNLQTFTSEAWAVFCNNFLNDSSGILKGCELSNTNNSVTIAEGYFVIKGRLLQIISSETISNISNNDGYYSLVCEIDLSKINTTSELNQAVIKTLYNASAYPTLTQQDITGSGTVYQYEFARFKVESGTITNFTDRRGNVIDNTGKRNSDFLVVTGTKGDLIQLPSGWNNTNTVVISTAAAIGGDNIDFWAYNLIDFQNKIVPVCEVRVYGNNVVLNTTLTAVDNAFHGELKVVLMKTN